MPTIRSFEIDSPQDFLLIEKIFHIISPHGINVERLSNIKMVIFDVDGVFTDGSVFLNEKNKEIIKFSRIDGKGIEIVQDSGIKVAIITSEDSNIVRNRMNKLNISDVYCGIKDKEKVYNMIKTDYGLDDKNICYCGDDIQDIKILKKVGFACCPQNAQLEAKKNSHYISTFNGGKGFVRDVCNILTSVREKNVT